MDLPEPEGLRLELDEGVLIEMPNPTFAHGAEITQLSHVLWNFLDQSGLDFQISTNTGFRLAPNVVRAPDLCLVRTSRLATMPVQRGALAGAPDFAVEIVSDSETAVRLNRKIRQYLNAGATAVWAFYLETRSILVYRRSGEIRQLLASDTLTEPDLLPGLSILVDKIFSPSVTISG